MDTHEVPGWHKEMSVGNPELDAQHILLVELATQLLELLQGRFSMSAIQGKITEFCVHVKAHVAHEERILASNACPGLDEHHSEHERYLQRFTALARATPLGDVQRWAFADAIEMWIASHLMNTDQRDRRYMR